MTTYLETDNGLMIPRSANGHSLSESVLGLQVDNVLLRETIANLQAQIAAEGWLRLGDDGAEFSRDTIGKIVASARVMYIKNPLINRACEVSALYVWGQDLSVSAMDEAVQEVVDRFWALNQDTLTGQRASRVLEVERSVTGNLFLALFADRATGDVRVRQVPMEEIVRIVSNPEDRADVWFYLRKWTSDAIDPNTGEAVPGPVERAFHPDWRHTPEDKPARIGNIVVRWDAPLIHDRSGAFPHWRWGVPEVYAALDWATAYKGLLEDDATRSRALAKFAFSLTTTGGAQGVAAAKTKLNTTAGSFSGETNPAPVAGATFIAGEGSALDPIKIAGANMDPGHSRPVRLMVASAVGLSDTLLSGDVDQSSLATATSLDRPTELGFSEKRAQRLDLLTEIIQYVIDADLAALGGLLTFTPDEEARKVDMEFPDLLERSVTERVQAVVDAATLLGRKAAGTMTDETLSRLLLSALGVDDIDGELQALQDEKDAKADEPVPPAPPAFPPNGDEGDMSREAFVAALRELREATRR